MQAAVMGALVLCIIALGAFTLPPIFRDMRRGWRIFWSILAFLVLASIIGQVKESSPHYQEAQTRKHLEYERDRADAQRRYEGDRFTREVRTQKVYDAIEKLGNLYDRLGR